MIIICLKIFMARIVDVTLGTIRTITLVQGKTLKATFLAFFEVLIWFIIAREALNIELDSIIIPISYASGYALGTYIGTYVSNNFINGFVSVQVITYKDNVSLKDSLKKHNYGYSFFTLNNEYDNIKKEMYLIKTEKKHLKKVLNIIRKYDKHSFILINDVKSLS